MKDLTTKLFWYISHIYYNYIRWWVSPVSCILKVREDFMDKHEPLILKIGPRGYELALPNLVDNFASFQLYKGEKIIIACPGNKNSVQLWNMDLKNSFLGPYTEELECFQKNIFYVRNEKIKVSDIGCKFQISSKLESFSKKCGANSIGDELELGFEIFGWHKILTVCFYKPNDTVMYARHRLYGSLLNLKKRIVPRPFFCEDRENTYASYSPYAAYKKVNQLNTLTNLLGKKMADKLMHRNFLSKGHLAPDADFVTSTWQQATFYYANTAPQWQSINAGYWRSVEQYVRNLAIQKRMDLDVITGIHGVLKLRSDEGIYKHVYLGQFKKLLPVPKYFWKLVVNPKENSCIVFIVYNNPMAKRKPKTLCRNICIQNGWRIKNTNITKGYVFCCAYDDFKKVVANVPSVKCSTVFRNTFK